MINPKPKKCKGTGTAINKGCSLFRYPFKYGLCQQCYYEFAKTQPRKQINKYSDKRKKQNIEYLTLRKKFLEQPENKICPITNKPTTDIHHKKGRIGKLLTDTSQWIALSREGHKFVEENPQWAKENKYSLNRL